MAERYQRQINEVSTPSVFIQNQNFDAPKIGNALSDFGSQLQRLADFQKNKQDEWDAATVMNAQVEFDKQLHDYLNNPDTGQFNLRKLSNAQGISDDTFNYADSLAEKITSQLENENQKRAFKKIAERSKLPYWKQASEFEARQISEFKNQAIPPCRSLCHRWLPLR